MLTFVSSLTCQRPSAPFRRFAEVVNSSSDLGILNYGHSDSSPTALILHLFDALVQCGVVVFRFRLLSLEVIVTVLALTSPGRC